MLQYNFNKSFLEWRVYDDYIGRFNIECIFENNDNPSDSYYLGSGIYACNVLQDEKLFKEPPYLFTPLFNNTQFTIFRDEANKTQHSSGNVPDIYNDVTIFVDKIPCIEMIESSNVLDSIQQQLPISGSFSYTIGNSVFTVHFPVKHINFRLSDKKFQVETGPLSLPYDENKKQWMLGYIGFNDFDSMEFLPVSSTAKSVRPGKPQKLKTNIKLYIPDNDR